MGTERLSVHRYRETECPLLLCRKLSPGLLSLERILSQSVDFGSL